MKPKKETIIMLSALILFGGMQAGLAILKWARPETNNDIVLLPIYAAVGFIFLLILWWYIRIAIVFIQYYIRKRKRNKIN